MYQGVNTVESGSLSLKNAKSSPVCDAHAHIGDEAETAAISESIEGQTAQFFIDALLPADDAAA